jgi:ABC-type branched-subunit amino acid transport system permease subunit
MGNTSNIAGTLWNLVVRGIPSALVNNKMLVATAAFLYLLPLFTTTAISPIRSLLYLITQIMIFGLLAMSFDLQLGRAGLLNFGQVALFGVGAYIMAFTLNPAVLPYPFNLIALIPYPFTLVLAMLVGAALGLIMGLTTNRMRGTAFAFIALAVAMFLYNFFAENTDISGGETGLRVVVPEIIRSAPFYVLFVSISFAFLAGFLGMMILYVKKRKETMGLVVFTSVLIAFTGVLLYFGTNVIGPIIVFIAFLGMIVLYFMERIGSIRDPLQYSEKSAQSETLTPTKVITKYILPPYVVVIAIIGLLVTFGSNILQLIDVWIQQTDVFYLTIPVQYYLVLTCVVIVYAFVRRTVESPFGRMVVAVAQNEDRSEALGFNTYHCKIVVLVISGAIAGLSGALFTPFIRTITPDSALGVSITINAMLYTIIGGIGTLLGPLLGTGVVVYSEQNLVNFIQEGFNLPGELWLIALGAIYIFIVLFMPFGIVGTIRNKALPLRERLLRLKAGRYEFAIKETDYWAFALLGAIGLFLCLLFVSL